MRPEPRAFATAVAKLAAVLLALGALAWAVRAAHRNANPEPAAAEPAAAEAPAQALAAPAEAAAEAPAGAPVVQTTVATPAVPQIFLHSSKSIVIDPAPVLLPSSKSAVTTELLRAPDPPAAADRD
jgi:hypothetical protein